MSKILPNEPLAIVITEAGSENLLFRALLKKAVVTLICGNQEKRNELSGLIATALDDVTPETCPDCGGVIFEECECGEDAMTFTPIGDKLFSDFFPAQEEKA